MIITSWLRASVEYNMRVVRSWKGHDDRYLQNPVVARTKGRGGGGNVACRAGNKRKPSQCGFCQNIGHNQQTCPALKKQKTLVDKSSTMNDINDDDDDDADYDDDNDGGGDDDDGDGGGGNVAYKACNKRKPSQCGFCQAIGHNKQTCHALKKQKNVVDQIRTKNDINDNDVDYDDGGGDDDDELCLTPTIIILSFDFLNYC
jgi:hypothetical protein